MIPLKEEPTLAEGLCFSIEDSDALNICRNALAYAGSVVITAASNESLLAHYTRVLLSQMSGQNGSSKSKLAVRRMPGDKDGLLVALNRLLAELDFEGVEAKKKVPTSEVWLYELPGPSDSEMIITTANMIRQFKAAGVSIIVNSRQARPGSELLNKLSQRVRGTLVEFALPDKEACIALAEKVSGTTDALQVNGLIKDLGHTIRRPQPASLAGFADESVSTQERLTQRVPIKPAHDKSRPASDLSRTRYKSKPSKRSMFSGAATVLAALFGIYALNGENWSNLKTSASTLYADMSTSIVSATETTAIAEVAPVLSDTSIAGTDTQLLTPTSESNTQSTPLVQMAALEESLAETLTTEAKLDSEQSLTELFIATPSRPSADAVYIQHASFRFPQGAFVYKSNAKSLAGTQIFSKGSSDLRYVVVSGPFLDRVEAQGYLDNAGVTDKAYFILGGVLGELVTGPNNILASME